MPDPKLLIIAQFASISDVELDANICYYILKNIAGQFCSVVEDECDALLQGTKDGKYQ